MLLSFCTFRPQPENALR